MLFLFQKPIANAIKAKFNIDINSDEYKNTVFSVDSIEVEDPVNFPFDRTYKGDILILKKYKPIYALTYTLKSRENLPEQSECLLTVESKHQAHLNLN